MEVKKDNKTYKYDVFISYKHTPLDIAISGTLQKKLERYTLSKEIQKKTGKKRIERVFRDKEELSTGVNLNEEIEEQLKNSEFLVIICSKESRKSPWVNRELETFLKYHDILHVLPIIVDGEPEEVYPQTLLNYGEPFALDVRSDSTKGSLKRLNQQFFKILAPILYCSYDELVQRQKKYRMQRWGILSTFVMVIALGFVAYVYVQNHKLKVSNQATLIEESKLLCNQAQVAIEGGDRLGALEYLLKALPDGEENRPVYPYAQYLLTNVLDVYQSSSGFGSLTASRIQHKVNENEEDLLIDEEGKYLFTRSGHTLSIWDANTLKSVRTIKTSSEFPLKEIKANHLLEDHRILLYDDNSLGLYDYESGKELWHSRFTNGLQQVLAIKNKTLAFVLGEDSIHAVNLESGKKEFSHRIHGLDPFKACDTGAACLSEDEDTLYFVGKDTEDENNLFSYDIKGNNLLNLTKEIEKDRTSKMVHFEKILLDENFLYLTGLSSDENEVIIKSYDLDSRKKLWEKEYRKNGFHKTGIKFLELEKKMLLLYAGRNLYLLDENSGEIAMSHQFAADIINMSSGDTSANCILSNGFLFQLNTETMAMTSLGAQFVNPLVVRKSGANEFFYVLTGEHDLVRYDPIDWEFNGSSYIELEDMIEEAFREKDCLFIKSRDSYHYMRDGDFTLHEIPLPWDEIESYALSYVGYDGEKVTFSNTGFSLEGESQIYKYYIYDLDTEKMAEEDVSEMVGYRTHFLGEKKLYLAECNNGRGKLFFHSVGEKDTDSYLYGKGDYVQSILPNENGNRVLIYDSTLLKVSLVDPENKKTLKIFSLRDWNQDVIELYQMHNNSFAKWSEDGEYFTLINQDTIYLYDQDGKEIQHFGYENSNDLIDVKLPYGSLSPDHEYFYYVYGNQIYRCSVKNGSCEAQDILEESMDLGCDEDRDLAPQFYYDQNQYLSLLADQYLVKVKTGKDCFGKECAIDHCIGVDVEKNRVYIIHDSEKIGYYDLLSLQDLINRGKSIMEGGKNDDEKE
ncbi:MAG: toll/interleukin-1 receptor domain-containing protein [Eubacteriales bacterium]|nr:toll/interleukin-1 receptor domain-containing protein [Eubacteriales bacterium]